MRARKDVTWAASGITGASFLWHPGASSANFTSPPDLTDVGFAHVQLSSWVETHPLPFPSRSKTGIQGPAELNAQSPLVRIPKLSLL